MSKVKTEWQTRFYEVWGNEEDGFQVNNTFSGNVVQLELSRRRYNANTPLQFYAVFPTNKQIIDILDIYPSDTEIEVLGDDTHIYVNSMLDGCPLGEMYCISHSSLSPIRKIENYVFMEE